MEKDRYHRLKTVQPYFNQLICGVKNFEIRKLDRAFKVGDFLLLEEFSSDGWTGNRLMAKIESILMDKPEYGLMKGYCIMGIYVHYSNEIYVKDSKGRSGRINSALDAKIILDRMHQDVWIGYSGKKRKQLHPGWECEIIGVDFPEVADESKWIEVSPEQDGRV